MVIARGGMTVGSKRIRVMLLKPSVDVVVIKLLRPQHACKGLAHDVSLVGAQRRRNHSRVEFVSFSFPRLHQCVEACPERVELVDLCCTWKFRGYVAKSQANRLRLPRPQSQSITGGRLRSNVLRVDGTFVAMDDVVVDAILNIGRFVGRVKKAFVICFILSEE